MDENKTKYSSYQAYAALGVGFVCLVVGLPLWWNTTRVYRVQLPYSDIESLTQQSMVILVKLELISVDDVLTSSDLAALKNLIQSKESRTGNVVIKYKVTLRQADAGEVSVYSKSASLSELDQRLFDGLKADGDHNKYHVICFPSNTHIKGDYPYIGAHRSAFVKFTNVPEASAHAWSILRDVIVQEASLETKYHSVDIVHLQKPDKESMRTVRSAGGYDATFSLVVHEPHIIDVRWDIRHFVTDYLKPFIEKLPIEINIKSQVLSYPGLFLRSQRLDNSSYYRHSDLPHMINPLESKLGSHMSNNPGLEFIVYVPTRDQSPLYIHDEHGIPVATNSFLSPQWGGILIYNIPTPPAAASLPHMADIRGDVIMPVFLAQLRLLLGVQSQVMEEVNISPLTSSAALHDWELDAFLRSRCVENVATATQTVRSLARLLAQIGNIVINDEIGDEVQRAVEGVQTTYACLERGDLMAAFTSSQRAINASEKAFFDPSLLELLYFPEDQKFAIYIPLFLPICIPVIMSVVQALKWIRSRRLPTTTPTTTTPHAKLD